MGCKIDSIVIDASGKLVDRPTSQEHPDSHPRKRNVARPRSNGLKQYELQRKKIYQVQAQGGSSRRVSQQGQQGALGYEGQPRRSAIIAYIVIEGYPPHILKFLKQRKRVGEIADLIVVRRIERR